MNGSAINQVLLSIPQSASASARSAGAKDSSTPDFSQALQDLNRQDFQNSRPDINRNTQVTRADRNQAAERNQVAERNRGAARDASAERNRAADQAERPEKAERAEKAGVPERSNHSKPLAKHTESIRRKQSNDVDETSIPQCANQDVQPAEAQPVDAQSVDVQQAELGEAVLTQNAVQGEDGAAEPDAEATANQSLIAALETTTEPEGQLLAGQSSGQVEVDVASTETPEAVGLVTEDVAVAEGSEKTVDVASSDELSSSAAKEETKESGATTPVENTADDGQQASALLNNLAAAAALVSGTDEGATKAVAVASPTVTATGAGPTTGVAADDVLSQVLASLPESAGQGDTADSSADTSDQTLAKALAQMGDVAVDADKGSVDKSGFEKMLKTVAQSALGEAGAREAQSAASSSSSSTASAADYLGRPLEVSGVSAQRNFVIQANVPVAVGQPQWSQAVGEKVLWLASQNITSAELNLHPQDLGPVQVKVTVNQDQANVTFTSHHPVVREVLDQNLNRLRDMFSEQGLNLVNVDVSDRSFQRQQGEGKEQQGQGGGNNQDTEEEAVAAVSVIKQQRLVDHYA